MANHFAYTTRRPPFLLVAWFQTSASTYMRTALPLAVTQRVVVILCPRFGTTHRSHLQGSKIKKNFIEAYSSSKAAFFGQPDFCTLQKLITQSFQRVFFCLLNLSSIPFLSAYSNAYSSRPQNMCPNVCRNQLITSRPHLKT